MNILFLSPGNSDYQCDILFHGLNELPGVTVYTNSDMWYMFAGNEPAKINELYGKGFSLYNRLKNDKRIEDASIITEKIKSKFYDCIIYGSIFRCSEYLDKILYIYPKQKIIFIDGEDTDFSLQFNFQQWWQLKHLDTYYGNYLKAVRLSKKGIYFKRELRNCDRKYFYPLSFAIPEENIITAPFPNKMRNQASIIPGKLSTYIYDNEKDYYEGYATSIYAVTTKKAGWDCLRHYEILANRCIPYFPGILNCPDYTMHLFPKTIIAETNRLIEKDKLNGATAEYYNDILYDITKNRLTTKKLAQYVLSMVV
jgi:hypothetical protein